MTLCSSFPRTRARVRPTHAFSAPPLFLLLAALFCSAAQTKAQPAAARPVARMIARTAAAPASLPAATPRLASAACTTRERYAHASAPGGFAATSPERRAFDLVNRERAARGQEQLVWDDELASMARQHSDNMARQNFFSHTDRTGRDTAARAAECGVCGWRALAENIAYNQGFDDPVAFAVERWMNSAKHRDNILRAGFTHAGLGIAKSADGTLYFTQVFVTR
ncbi:MAG TPA: CAP domain-containing protein [Pyrinomonadaceae bacterium]|jgi:uncharacterized protein YkwD|nr:CAP domain-containing protein [Pyrinomonadaceae bacterium]